jgi:maltooligosyltrehalose trehalohydrolase
LSDILAEISPASTSVTPPSAHEGSKPSQKGWGAHYLGNDNVSFRIWVPQAAKISLRIGGHIHAMKPQADGWLELTLPDISPGTAYRFVLPDGTAIPDPASRSQHGGIKGDSLVIDHSRFPWKNTEFQTLKWEKSIIYELHIGTFTDEGTFAAAQTRLPYLRALGITAIEVMPVAEFEGLRGWGYDGVLLYTPHHVYGSPDDMKSFVDAAHGHGIQVILDVVYNHFGAVGNYLPSFAPDFFDPDLHTPWGSAIDFEKKAVRDFFIDNALCWLRDYNLDGLRIDAVHEIHDEHSSPHFIEELSQRVHHQLADRPRHLIIEDSKNSIRFLDPAETKVPCEAAWNDDFHHVVHVIASGEKTGYYADFADTPWFFLARSLAEGFVFQGEPAGNNEGKPLGDPSTHLRPQTFVDFLQNHDQIGNRAFGERLAQLSDPKLMRLLTAILILSPHIPLIFMGEEYGETNPFMFFCDYEGEMAEIVRNGRKKEVGNFCDMSNVKNLDNLPDPNAIKTFKTSKLNWENLAKPEGLRHLQHMRDLISKRLEYVVPALAEAEGNSGHTLHARGGAIAVDWQLGSKRLQLRANMSEDEVALPRHQGTIIHHEMPDGTREVAEGSLSPMSLIFSIAG